MDINAAGDLGYSEQSIEAAIDVFAQRKIEALEMKALFINSSV